MSGQQKTWCVLVALLAGSLPCQVHAGGQAEAGPKAAPPAEAALEPPLPKGDVPSSMRFRTGGAVTTLQLSPDGKKLISGSVNGSFVWDAGTGKLILRVDGGIGGISHDGKRLYVSEGTAKHTVLKEYDLASGKVLKTIDEKESVFSMALSPDDRTLALEFVDWEKFPKGDFYTSRLELRDLATDRVLHKFGEQQSSGSSHRLLFAPDGKSLLAIDTYFGFRPGKTCTMRRFDVASAQLKSQMDIDGNFQPGSLIWDGKSLLANGTKIWDLDKQRLHWSSRGDLGAIYAFMPDGKTVLGVPGKSNRLGSQTPSPLVQWDLEKDREIRRFDNLGGCQFVVAKDGKSVYGGHAAASLNRVFHWDFATGEEIVQDDVLTQVSSRCIFSPDQKLVASVDLQALHVWDRATGKRVHRESLPSNGAGPLRFTPDGKTLVFIGSAKVHTFDTATWKMTEHALPERERGFNQVQATFMQLSPDGKTLVGVAPSAGRGAINLWDWASGKVLATLNKGDAEVGLITAAEFSPDGKRLACVHFPSNRVRIWDLANKKVLADWKTKGDYLASLQFVEDGELIAGRFLKQTRTGEPINPTDWIVRFWNSTSGEELYRFPHPVGKINETLVQISADGKYAATASPYFDVVRFWDPANGKQLGESRQPGGAEAIAFSADGRFLAVAGQNTTVLIVDRRRVIGE